MFFGNKNEPKSIQASRLQEHRDISSGWFLFNMMVSVRTPELAKLITSDTETFAKTDPLIFKEGKEFLGQKHLVLVDGHDWKRHRGFLEPAFRNLDLYEKIFEEKTKLVLKKIEDKGEIIEDANDFTTKMALDILGLSIFGFDFCSINGSTNKELKAYHHMMGVMNSTNSALYYVLKEMILGKYSKNPDLDENNQIFNELISRLIKASKEKKEGRDFSMLDMMVASQEQEEGLSDLEIRDNVSIFFLAGHGNFLFIYS